MTTITLPAFPKTPPLPLRLNRPAQVNTAGWTGRRQVMPSGRGWWECSVSLTPIVGRENFRPWQTFLMLTDGPVNDFRVPVDPSPQSKLPNTVLVKGAGQTGTSLITDGWPANSTVLKAGMFVTVVDQLVQLTANATSNGAGEATLTFKPALRVAPGDNAAVEYKNPYCLMFLTEEPSWSVDQGYIYNMSLNLRESF